MIYRLKKSGLCLMLMCSVFSAFCQKAIPVSLKKDKLHAINREIKELPENTIYVNARENPGVVWIQDLALEKGSIEFDVKGKDVLQESFVGIAFHGLNDSTYEAVYFRPFNFNAKDSLRKIHAVQYMALPDYDWPYLRENFTGKYEAPMPSFIDPDHWFHVKVIVSVDLISVFINKDRKPALEITPLVKGFNGKIGLWTGHGSDGTFANLIITDN